LPAARPAGSPWAALAGDGDLYLFADARQARGLLEPLAEGFTPPREGGRPGSLAPLLDRAEEVYACVYLPAPGGAGGPAADAPAVELAVTGRFSPDLVGLRLDWSCGWRRHPSKQATAQSSAPPYWSARGQPLEVGSPARGLLLAAAGRSGALERMQGRRLAPETGPVERARADDPRAGPFLAGAALYACLPSRRVAEPAGSGEGGAAGVLPLASPLFAMRMLWLAARRQGEQYELGVLAVLAGEPNARALAGLVRLVAAAWLRKAGVPEVTARLRALDIAVDAGGLAVRGLRLSEKELLALLRGGLPLGTGGAGARSGN
jgi:hypothetical protein